jgi:hypothetical protein
MIKVRTVSGPITYRKKLNLADRAYLAGFLDAKARFDARIARYKGRSYDEIEALTIVYGKDRNVLSMLQRSFGGTITVQDRREIGGKLVYRWQVKNKADIVPMIKHILPYLKIKRKQAALLMRYCSSRSEKMSEDKPFEPITDEERRIVKQLIELNKKELKTSRK